MSNLYLFDLDWTILGYYFYPEVYRCIINHYNLETRTNIDKLREEFYKVSTSLFSNGRYLDAYDWDLVLSIVLKRYNIEVDKSFAEFVIEHINDEGVNYKEGVLDAFDYIRDRNGVIGVLTNGYKKYQEIKVKKSNLLKYVDFIVFIDDVGTIKPFEDFFHFGITKGCIDSECEEVYYIGDDLFFDVAGALNAGIRKVFWFNEKSDTEAGLYDMKRFLDHLLMRNSRYGNLINVNKFIKGKFFVIKSYNEFIKLLDNLEL